MQHNIKDGSGGHSSPVVSLACGGNLLASGSVDGVAKLFNVQAGKTVGTFACGGPKKARAADGADGAAAAMNEEEEEVGKSAVESIVFPKGEQNIFITGCLDGVVNVWDVPTQVGTRIHEFIY